PQRDATGAAIALFTANLHYPLTVTHKTTLQGVVYQLDVALQNADTQKAGLVFIYDMSGSKYSNFDYDLSQKILTLLKAVQQFIDAVSSRKAVSPATAIKFLLARKFDVPRAVALYEQHELIRQKEGLYSFDPMCDPLRSELETGKFTILVVKMIY
uniref:CRAL/TRIO N-terminal domain-containing protein n=1 Tax=Phlebotomus papatasi TaxID=29031 RepID=A0A1B0D3S9_PHLPP